MSSDDDEIIFLRRLVSKERQRNENYKTQLADLEDLCTEHLPIDHPVRIAVTKVYRRNV